jgi:hypothetical protein
MVWVWVIPGLILCYALVAAPNLSPDSASVLMHSDGMISRYFGWACQPRNGCLDQLVITMPFYTAAAYSIGARLGLGPRTSSAAIAT